MLSSGCQMQLTLGPCVVQIWSRDTLDLRGSETLVLHPVANTLAPHRGGADDGFERLPGRRGEGVARLESNKEEEGLVATSRGITIHSVEYEGFVDP